MNVKKKKWQISSLSNRNNQSPLSGVEEPVHKGSSISKGTHHPTPKKVKLLKKVQSPHSLATENQQPQPVKFKKLPGKMGEDPQTSLSVSSSQDFAPKKKKVQKKDKPLPSSAKKKKHSQPVDSEIGAIAEGVQSSDMPVQAKKQSSSKKTAKVEKKEKQPAPRTKKANQSKTAVSKFPAMQKTSKTVSKRQKMVKPLTLQKIRPITLHIKKNKQALEREKKTIETEVNLITKKVPKKNLSKKSSGIQIEKKDKSKSLKRKAKADEEEYLPKKKVTKEKEKTKTVGKRAKLSPEELKERRLAKKREYMQKYRAEKSGKNRKNREMEKLRNKRASQRASKKIKNKVFHFLRRAVESPEDTDKRMEKQKILKNLQNLKRRLQRLNETKAEREARLQKARIRAAFKKANETPEQRAQRLAKIREREKSMSAAKKAFLYEKRKQRIALKRANETPEEREKRLSKRRGIHIQMTPEKRELKRARARSRHAEKRSKESTEEREKRLEREREYRRRNRERMNSKRNDKRRKETEEERNARLERQRIRNAERRARETPEETAARKARERAWGTRNRSEEEIAEMKRQWRLNRLSKETPEQREKRLSYVKRYKKRELTEEELQRRRQKLKEWRRKKIANETPEQRRIRLEKNKAFALKYRRQKRAAVGEVGKPVRAEKQKKICESNDSRTEYVEPQQQWIPQWAVPPLGGRPGFFDAACAIKHQSTNTPSNFLGGGANEYRDNWAGVETMQQAVNNFY